MTTINYIKFSFIKNTLLTNMNSDIKNGVQNTKNCKIFIQRLKREPLFMIFTLFVLFTYK